MKGYQLGKFLVYGMTCNKLSQNVYQRKRRMAVKKQNLGTEHICSKGIKYLHIKHVWGELLYSQKENVLNFLAMTNMV